MNRVCQILGIAKPVVQAPMLWITSPELVAAVSNAGGLGVLGFNAGTDVRRDTAEETAAAASPKKLRPRRAAKVDVAEEAPQAE